MKTLLVDGDNLLKIGIFGVKNYYNKEQHIGGIFYFLNTLRKHLDEHQYDKIVVFWDGDNNDQLRRHIYPWYKDNRRIRTNTEEEKLSTNYQRIRVKAYLEELFIRQGEYENVETDDCIAFYCQNSPLETKTIFSGDIDLTQLISEQVRIYSPKSASFITITDKVLMDHIEIPPQNVMIAKIICGDTSDNVSGIKSLGIKTLASFFPKMLEEKVSLEELMSGAQQLSETNQTKALANLLTGTSKYGEFGEEFFRVNKKLVDLSQPLLTEQAKFDIIEIVQQALNPENRGWKNLIKMMMEDGLFNVLPRKDNGWTHFFTPFLLLARKEKKFYNN